MKQALFSLCVVQFQNVSIPDAAEPTFVCKPVAEWTAILDRTDGWIADDSIFGIEGVSTQGSETETSKTLFVFGDSLIGAV